jgi:hypothetical protein
MSEPYKLTKSKRKNKKYSINMGQMIHHFGDSRYEDYTEHQNEKRKISYLARHSVREDWSKSGFHTSGFWSRWLLWNKPSIKESIKDIEKRFDIKINKL